MFLLENMKKRHIFVVFSGKTLNYDEECTVYR